MEGYKRKYIEDLNAIITNCETLKNHCCNLIKEVDNEQFFEPTTFYNWVARNNISDLLHKVYEIKTDSDRISDNRDYMIQHYGLYKKD